MKYTRFLLAPLAVATAVALVPTHSSTPPTTAPTGATVAKATTVNKVWETPEVGAPTAPDAHTHEAHEAEAASAIRPSALKAKSSGKGYALMSPNIIGQTPKGFNVYVKKGTKNANAINAVTKSAVSQWRSAGLNVTYRGWGTPALKEGVVLVSENSSGCASGKVGNTRISWHTTPTGAKYVIQASAVMCPQLWTGRYASWNAPATIRHELGHSLGLGHYNSAYGGSTQIMRSANANKVTTYRKGDVAGFRYFAANRNRIVAEMAPKGHYDAIRYDMATKSAVVTGWALNPYAVANPINIQVTDNGKLVVNARTSVYRGDINNAYDKGSKRAHGFNHFIKWTGGKHTYCVTAVSSTNYKVKTNLGCAGVG